MLPKEFCNERNRCKSNGVRSGLYGGCINTSQPSSVNFCCMAIDECGLVLSWWTPHPSCSPTPASFSQQLFLTSSVADCRGQNRQFYPVAKAHSGRFFSNPTIHITLLCSESGRALLRPVGLVHASTMIFSHILIIYHHFLSPIINCLGNGSELLRFTEELQMEHVALGFSE